jgi:hypothetical protein
LYCKWRSSSGIACKRIAVQNGYCELHHPAFSPTATDIMKNFEEMMKIPDPLKEIKESALRYEEMMKLADPFKEIRESAMKYEEMMKISDPLKGIKELALKYDEMMRVSDPFKKTKKSAFRYEEMMKLADPFKGIRESAMKYQAIKIADPMQGFREIMKHFLPIESFTNAIEATNLWKQFGDLYQQINDLQSTINKESLEHLFNEIQSVNSLADIKEFGMESLVNADGTVSISEESISISSLHEVVEKVISNALETQTNSIVQAIERLITEIKTLKEPWIKQLFIQMVCLLIFAFVNPYIDYKEKKYLDKNQKKYLSNHLNKVVAPQVKEVVVLDSYRYVSADILKVRQCNNRNGKLLGYLYFGQVVKVIEKQKDWSRVRWLDETGKNSIEGWVYTRYLKKFKVS